jgi:hypothetical protein
VLVEIELRMDGKHERTIMADIGVSVRMIMIPFVHVSPLDSQTSKLLIYP